MEEPNSPEERTGSRVSPETGIKRFFERLLEQPQTRREFLKIVGVAGITGAAAGAAVTGIPLLLKEAKTRQEREEILTGLTHSFLDEYDWEVAVDNQPPPISDLSKFKDKREQARFLLEQGSRLVSEWASISKGDRSYFDNDGRLHLEGRKFAVNENVRDFHLALNLIRAKLALLTETNPQERELLQEDYEDLIFLADLKPEIEISPKAWIIMPKDWALSLARFSLILKRNEILFPSKFIIDPEIPSRTNFGGYYEGTSERFPTPGQQLFMSPFGNGEMVFHEGGHYIADLARITERIIGLPRGKEFPDHQIGFERALGRIQQSLILNAKAKGLKSLDELAQFFDSYQVTNPTEDFAVVFENFCFRGPALKKLIEDLRVNNPQAAALLEARYEYIRTEVLRGEEFSFRARKKRLGILSWEGKQLKASALDRQDLVGEDESKYRSEFIRSLDGFEDADVSIVVPEGDFDYALALLQPKLWEDILHTGHTGEIKSTSSFYPIVHQELRGRFTLKVNTQEGEEKVSINTEDPKSIEHFIGLIPEIINVNKTDITPPKIKWSEENLRLLGELGLEPPKVSLGGWGPPFPSLIDNQVFYVHFQYNEKTKNWETMPLDMRQLRVHTTTVGNGKPLTFSNYHLPIKIGKKDIFLAINFEARIYEIRGNGVDHLSLTTPSLSP